ncbi:MAG: PqqD family peptide modification chaperone [Ardenticatenia bacterium]|nr:PqqD family peptide modification chaperone [Ardenticatenia bacterium]
MSKISRASTVWRSPEQVFTHLDGEIVILGLQSEAYFGLKGAGVRIWELIQEPITVQAVLEKLLEEYEVERERCERDLLAFLDRLADAGLIEVRDGQAT